MALASLVVFLVAASGAGPGAVFTTVLKIDAEATPAHVTILPEVARAYADDVESTLHLLGLELRSPAS